MIILSAFFFLFSSLSAFAEDTPPPKKTSFSVQTINAGWHHSRLFGHVDTANSRRFWLSFDNSAIYDLKNEDQADWNKLPGFSDCGSVDLSQNGAMWAWRWNTKKDQLELSPYTNVRGKHLSADNTRAVKILALTRQDLAQFTPLHYGIEIHPAGYYIFSIHGKNSAGIPLSQRFAMPRACKNHGQLKYFSSFYFGGTSTAPHSITAYIKE